MNQTQAMVALKRMFGAKAAWQRNERAPRAEEREVALAQLPELQAKREAAKQAVEKRRAELLSDPLYQQLRAEYEATRKASDEALSLTYRYRVTVGTTNGIFFTIAGQGDNWQEAVEDAQAKIGKNGVQS
jgi:hypothetical protein